MALNSRYQAIGRRGAGLALWPTLRNADSDLVVGRRFCRVFGMCVVDMGLTYYVNLECQLVDWFLSPQSRWDVPW